MLTRESRLMEVFMYDISLRRKDKYMDRETIDICIKSLQNQIKDSTLRYFENNHFFQELPQNLQYRLVKSVLARHLNIFTFFFEDFNSRKRASDAFILKVLTRLRCQLYKHGETIIRRGDRVRDLIIISKGTVNLYGFYEDMNKNEFRTMVVNLPRKSWYGDY